MRAFSTCPGQASIREGLNPIPVIGVVKYINVHEILTQQIDKKFTFKDPH